ncbi:GNAT family N-acetyltransferase [Kitasatospora sp. NPDC059599]|uniref:GNAT family N-acetyltransferase n=1 Tax=Kitasatospora sp. NPDC059599 TaxID=3346880 RepID=UPI0036A13C12
MIELLTAHTAELEHAVLTEARELLIGVFEGDMTVGDWEHALGGVHALLIEDGVLIGHASVVQRRMLHGDRALRAGYVEGVGVRADRRGRGHGGALMDAVERVVRGAYEVGVLGSSDEAVPFYRRRGWQPWRGPLCAITPGGLRPTPDEEGAVFVLPGSAPLDLDGRLACDWRDGDVW